MDNIISDEVKSSPSSSPENKLNEKIDYYNDIIKKLQAELISKVFKILEIIIIVIIILI